LSSLGTKRLRPAIGVVNFRILAGADALVVLVDSGVALAGVGAAWGGSCAAVSAAGDALLHAGAAEGAWAGALIAVLAFAAPADRFFKLAVIGRFGEGALRVGLLLVGVW